MSVVHLLDLPDELLLAIMKKVEPQVLLLCSMINIGNHRLEQVVFDGCHSIDLTFDFCEAPHKSLTRKFYSHVMPRIGHNIHSLTIQLQHILSITTYFGNNFNGTLPNLTHFKIVLGIKSSKTGVPHSIGWDLIYWLRMRSAPLFSFIPQYFVLPKFSYGEKVRTLCCSSIMRSVQSFELDDNCMVYEMLSDNELRFHQVTQLTHIRISFGSFYQCIHLLNQLGSQLHSFIVTIATISDDNPYIDWKIESISCPNLKKLSITIYRNFSNYERCISLLQRLSYVEYLTLLLAIGRESTRPNRFIDGSVLERNILSYMPRLRQFNFHIRSILKNASRITIDQIRQSFVKQQQPFHVVLDYFANNYGQCQIYSLPFIGTRLDFISNRFPLFDINNIFSKVTTLLLFDDVKPFESIFFERLARALPRLKTLEIMNQLKQQEKTTATKTNIDFTHLAVLILFDIHMDYAEQFFYQFHLPSLIELAIDKEILLTIFAQNHPQAKDNCSRVNRLITSKPSYELIGTIRNFFPLADYVKHCDEPNQ